MLLIIANLLLPVQSGSHLYKIRCLKSLYKIRSSVIMELQTCLIDMKIFKPDALIVHTEPIYRK